MLQTWNELLDGEKAQSHETPVTRVVTLLKNVQVALNDEMTEDEALHKKLACWCNDNKYEKGNAITASEAKIAELTSSVSATAAATESLTVEVQQLNDQVTADKKSLKEAAALREKEAKVFRDMELKSGSSIESLRAAIAVLDRVHAGASSAAAMFAQFQSSIKLSLLSLSARHREQPFDLDHESDDDRQMDAFLAAETPLAPPAPKFLRQVSALPSAAVEHADESVTAAPSTDEAVIRRGIASAAAFVQHKYGGEYAPQSGEILGVLKQLKDEMSAELSEAEVVEKESAATFAAMREGKTAEIRSAEEDSERKEDRLAEVRNEHAEAKEDLDKEQASLSEAERFAGKLQTICAESDSNFAARKQARLEEIQAVSETIGILTEDAARDAMKGTYSLVQLWARHTSGRAMGRRARAAAVLKVASARHPELAILATSVQLDAFARVKKAIDDMVAMLRIEQADEVKKSDWCNAELHTNDMASDKSSAKQKDLSASIGEMETAIASIVDEIDQAQAAIAELHTNLQRASEDRKAENHDFQLTISDQTMTIEALTKASGRLREFYAKNSLVQAGKHGKVAQARKNGQTPPVAQMSYEPSTAATGIIGMIEKLIGEARTLMVDAKSSEGEAQTAYEELVASTNDSVVSLQRAVTGKIENKAATVKDKAAAEGDLADTVGELEDLWKYGKSLHSECDYLLKNFDIRQQARSEEIASLQQAKGILSGASGF